MNWVGPIEKGIPVPAGPGPYLRTQMEKMAIGDSILIQYTLGAAWKMAQKLGIKVTVRSVEGGRRVWRIE